LATQQSTETTLATAQAQQQLDCAAMAEAAVCQGSTAWLQGLATHAGDQLLCDGDAMLGLDMLLQLQDCVSGLQDQTAAGTIQTDEQLHAGLLGTAWMK
jgi:hypothetical protein